MLTGAIMCAGLITFPVFYYGKVTGNRQAQTEMIAKSVKVLRERGNINEAVSNDDAVKLCADFGLLDSEQIECVRRIRETQTKH